MTDLFAESTVSAAELEGRRGFDPGFLGVDVPMPALATTLSTLLLHYLHYSVLMRPDRRFAALTALNLDGSRLLTVDRSDRWKFDPRLAAELQAGPPVYANNDLDRGHLVMRASSTWGATKEEADKAEADTFFFTNAAPQAATFNQGRELWLGLEEYLLEHAAGFDRRLVVLAGPVLEPTDPPYRGIQVPLRSWKVVAFVQGGALAATGYLLDQSPMVDDLQGAIAEAAAAGNVPALGPFRTFQVPIADVAALTGLVLDQLALVDRLGAPVTGVAPPPGQVSTGWKELGTLEDIVLTN
jgi:endonuclease G, mitochondrial